MLRLEWLKDLPGSFSYKDNYYVEPEEISDHKESGFLSHKDYYDDESDDILEDDDGLAPLRSYRYDAVEE